LGDYSKIRDDLDLVLALKERFQEAQGILRTLNMAPSTVARDKRWFREPWIFESQDPKYWGYIPPKLVQAGEDGDGEVLRDAMASAPSTANPLGETGEALMNLEDDPEDDGLDPVPIAENECRNALAALMNEVEPPLVESEIFIYMEIAK
jgi:hypothetical protein